MPVGVPFVQATPEFGDVQMCERMKGRESDKVDGEIEVTPEMVEAGGEVIFASVYFEGLHVQAKDIALEVYLAMAGSHHQKIDTT